MTTAHDTAPDAEPWLPVTLGGMEFAVPPGWANSASSTPDVAVYLAPEDAGRDLDGHRPTLVATIEACSVTAAEYSTQAMSEFMTRLSLLHIVDVDLWAPAGGEATAGRRIEFTHTTPGSQVHAVQYQSVHAGTAYTLTFTCSERALPRWDEPSWQVGDRVRLIGPTSHPGSEPPRPGALPRLAQYASVRAGVPLESLHAIAPQQPFRSAGPVLADADAALLLQLAITDGHRPPGRSADPGVLQALTVAGLTGPDGTLTPEGNTVTTPLRHPAGRASLTAHHGGDESRLALFHGREGQSLLLAQRPVSDLRGDQVTMPAGHTRLDFLPVWLTASTANSWLGLGPAWLPAGDPVSVPFQDFDRRVREVTPVPAGLPTSWALAWDAPWVVWEAEGDGGSATYLHAGEHGHHLVESDGDGGVLLTPVPARNVYRHLSALLGPAGAGYGIAEP